jgi:hypothetical protein
MQLEGQETKKTKTTKGDRAPAKEISGLVALARYMREPII